MATKGSRSWTGDRTWTMWVGERRDLEQLLQMIVDQAEQVRPKHIAEATEYTQKTVERLRARVDEVQGEVDASDASHPYRLERAMNDLGIREGELEVERREAANAAVLTVDVIESRAERQSETGDLADVMSIVDERRCRELSINAPAFRSSSLTIDIHIHGEGVRLRVRADDVPLGRAAFAAIARELDDTAPRYAMLAEFRLLSALSVAASSSVAVAVLLGLLGGSHDLPLLLTSGVFLGLVFALPVGWALRKYLLPGFSLVRDGHTHRARRTWGLVGATVLWASGIAIPFILG